MFLQGVLLLSLVIRLVNVVFIYLKEWNDVACGNSTTLSMSCVVRSFGLAGYG